MKNSYDGYQMEKTSITTRICDLELDTPIIMAAGILGISTKLMKRAIKNGAGAVVTKSIGLEARNGNNNPVIAGTPCGILNSMGLPNPGANVFRNELKENEVSPPLIGSVYGFTKAEFVKVAETLETVCDAIELNVSCPNVQGTGTLFGQDPALVKKTTKAVKQHIQKPLFVKLTPNVTDIAEIAKAAEKGGADAITAINTVKGMRINIETRKPILAAKTGGLSGPAIKPIAIRCVYELYQAVDIPILGCGGVTNWQDAIEFFLAGASAVQLGTGIMRKGFEIFHKINQGMKNFLERKEYEQLSDLIGNAVT